MGRRAWGFVCVLLVVGGLATPPTLAATGGFARILHVPADYRTVQAAVGASKPGDLILLDQGTYPGEVNVPEDKHDLTIRGVSRDGVVFDGDDRRANAIEVEADRVALENMSAHDFTANAFYWDSVDGFLGRYLTAWNVQLYGIYSLKSRHGIIEQSYVSGAADAAFYIGECYPCDTVIRGVTGRLSAVGYSGTNAGGGVTVRDSLWERNGVGILPNSYETGQEPPPQQDAVFTGNRVIGSGTVPTPVHTVLAGFIGIGIGVAGGQGNRIERNVVTGSERYGIALFTTVQRDRSWDPLANVVQGNRVSGSGVADLAMSTAPGPGNCITANRFDVSLPPGGGSGTCGHDVGLDGSEEVRSDLVRQIPALLERFYADHQPPSYASMPKPPPQPNLPNVAPARGPWRWFAGLLVAGAVAGAAGLVFPLRSRRRDLGHSREGRPRTRVWPKALAAAGAVAMMVALAGLALTSRTSRPASVTFPAGTGSTPSSPRPPEAPDPQDVGGQIAYGVPEQTGAAVIVGTVGAPATAGDVTIATFAHGLPQALRWSPDGTRVAFTVRFFDTLKSDVYVANADGSGEPVLVTADEAIGQCGSPSWSPDGERLVFECAPAMINPDQYDGPPGLYLGSSDGTGIPRPWGSGWAESPSWSSDGTRVAFESRRDGNYEIYAMNADGKSITRLTNTPQDDRHPTWSPDGTEIAFDSERDTTDTSTTDGPGSGDPTTTPSLIYVMNADGSDVRLVSQLETVEELNPRWPSPDVVAFTLLGPGGEIAIGLVRSTGSEVFHLTGPYEAFDWRT